MIMINNQVVLYRYYLPLFLLQHNTSILSVITILMILLAFVLIMHKNDLVHHSYRDSHMYNQSMYLFGSQTVVFSLPIWVFVIVGIRGIS